MSETANDLIADRPPTISVICATYNRPAVLANASGFVYYVSVAGITGKASGETDQGRSCEVALVRKDCAGEQVALWR